MRSSRVVIAGIVSVLLARTVWAATPVSSQQFLSSSGRTFIGYYDYDAGPCGSAGPACDFRGVLRVPRGFGQAEAFIVGFHLKAGLQSDSVEQVSVNANRFWYDPATGEVEVGLGAVLRNGSGQPYSYRLTFVIILTASGVASFTPVTGGCGGTARCHVLRNVQGAVPKGMRYVGLASSTWQLGSGSGPLLLNTLSGHVDSLTVTPPDLNLDYLCVMHGQRAANRMFCEWSAKAIAFDPSEMTGSNSPSFPSPTFLSWGTASRAGWLNGTSEAAQLPIVGFLDAFQGLTLTYQTFPPTPPKQHAVWSIESSAGNFHLDPARPDTALSEYGILLGTIFGNSTNTQGYAYQSSRALGFLR